MPRTPDELLAEALELPEEARARIAQSLIASLDGDEDADPAEIEREWLAEARRRVAEIDSGVVLTQPAAEVFRAAREELRRLRSRTRGG
ncbi:MAG: addiction module protein [Gemmatimonadota bacterium]